MSSRTSRNTKLVIAEVELERVDGEDAVHLAARAFGGELGGEARVRRAELAIAARPVERVDREIEAAVGGERAQRIGLEAHVAARVDVADQAGERAGALERDREVVEVEAGHAALGDRRQRRQSRDTDASTSQVTARRAR